MIRRETGDDHICVLTFDRPNSGANIFDAATLDDLNEHLDAVEKDDSLRGLIIASAKKSIFVAGADLKTLLQAAKTGEMRGFIEPGHRFSIAWPILKSQRLLLSTGRRQAAVTKLRWRAIIASRQMIRPPGSVCPKRAWVFFPPGAAARDCRGCSALKRRLR